jgi:hypothetical protein
MCQACARCEEAFHRGRCRTDCRREGEAHAWLARAIWLICGNIPQCIGNGLEESVESWRLTDTWHVQFWKWSWRNMQAARYLAKCEKKRSAKPHKARPGAPPSATCAMHSSLDSPIISRCCQRLMYAIQAVQALIIDQTVANLTAAGASRSLRAGSDVRASGSR